MALMKSTRVPYINKIKMLERIRTISKRDMAIMRQDPIQNFLKLRQKMIQNLTLQFRKKKETETGVI